MRLRVASHLRMAVQDHWAADAPRLPAPPTPRPACAPPPRPAPPRRYGHPSTVHASVKVEQSGGVESVDGGAHEHGPGGNGSGSGDSMDKSGAGPAGAGQGGGGYGSLQPAVATGPA
jgi:hypothetical protein